jgi:hypothetical protein
MTADNPAPKPTSMRFGVFTKKQLSDLCRWTGMTRSTAAAFAIDRAWRQHDLPKAHIRELHVITLWRDVISAWDPERLYGIDHLLSAKKYAALVKEAVKVDTGITVLMEVFLAAPDRIPEYGIFARVKRPDMDEEYMPVSQVPIECQQLAQRALSRMHEVMLAGRWLVLTNPEGKPITEDQKLIALKAELASISRDVPWEDRCAHAGDVLLRLVGYLSQDHPHRPVLLDISDLYGAVLDTRPTREEG